MNKPLEPIALTHLAEAIFVELINQKRNEFFDLVKLKGVDKQFFNNADRVAFREVPLERYEGKAFDGASRVDVVVTIAKGKAIAFELKLGLTRLYKKAVNELLTPCESTHGGSRWSGNMMAILSFPTDSAQKEKLSVTVMQTAEDGVSYSLEKEWFIVARRNTIRRWESGAEKPNFNKNVRFLAFEDVVEKLGGKAAFNSLVRQMLKFDFYDTWFPDSK